MIGYCVKCKKKREMSNPRSAKMKNGRAITKGMCPVCKSGMCRIGG